MSSANNVGESDKFLQNGVAAASNGDAAAARNGDAVAVEVEVKDAASSNKEEEEEADGKKKCCTKKCCLIATCVVVGLVVAVVIVGYVRYRVKYAGTAEEASSEKITGRLNHLEGEVLAKLNVSGNYKMTKFDDSYELYLDAMGVPGFVIALITEAGYNEVITVIEPDRPQGVWAWAQTKSSGKREYWFRLGEEFEFIYGSKVTGSKWKTCTRPRQNVLSCDVEEREKNLKMLETYTFDGSAMVQSISVLNRGNITTVRLFERKTDRELKEEKEEEERKAASEPAIFSEDDEDDEAFWDDEKKR